MIGLCLRAAAGLVCPLGTPEDLSLESSDKLLFGCRIGLGRRADQTGFPECANGG
jgi:hypothetical protein